MIDSVYIRNFQSHKRSKLEFHPGVNVIIGKSDSGKTAISRAINWVFRNKPSGDAFRSHWGGTTEVKVKLSDGNEVIRCKQNTDNFYALNEARFTAFGTDIPKEIVQALNINEVNLQTQFDPPFLLTKSPGEVAAHFNKIAKIEQIDISTKKINKLIKGVEEEINIHKHNLKTMVLALENYSYLGKFEAELEVLESMESRVAGLEKERDNLKGLVEEIEALTEKINSNALNFAYEDLLNIILSEIDKSEDLAWEYDVIESLVNQLESIQVEINSNTVLIKLESIVNNTIDLYKQLDEEEDGYLALKTLIKDIGEVNSKLEEKTLTIDKKEKRFKDNFPEKCPLCGSPKNK